MPKIIQFFHPGQETPDRFICQSYKEWKTGDHSRNFIKNHGDYVDENGQYNSDDLVFWGEWEARARVKKTFFRKTEPQRLIEPIKCMIPSHRLPMACSRTKCGSGDSYQNTDPFVFGDCFRYSYCKQKAFPFLKALDEDSIILFGSHKKGKFLLDTVFVVGNNPRKYRNKKDLNDIPNYGDYCNYLLDLTDIKSPDECVYYEGKTFSSVGMFSFSPSKVFSEKSDCTFHRVELDANQLSSFFAGTSFSDWQTQGINFQEKKDFPKDVIQQGWEKLKNFVFEQGCVLGVKFDIPTKIK